MSKTSCTCYRSSSFHSVVCSDAWGIAHAMRASGNYSLQAQHLIYGAGRSWVFGGMGSWNDLGGFEGKEKQDKYYKLTEELYEAVIVAFLAGINS